MEETFDENNVAGTTVLEDVGLFLSRATAGDGPNKFTPLHIFDNLVTSMLIKCGLGIVLS